MRIDSLIIKLIQYLIDKEKSEKKNTIFPDFLTFQQGIFILPGHGAIFRVTRSIMHPGSGLR